MSFVAKLETDDGHDAAIDVSIIKMEGKQNIIHITREGFLEVIQESRVGPTPI